MGTGQRWTSLLLLGLTGAATLAAQKVTAPAPDGSLVIESPRPLHEATAILADRYGVPITLEEPKWLSNEDMKIGTMIVGALPRFVLPGGLYPELTPTAEAATQMLIDAYNRQNRQGIRFRVEKSGWGVQVLPTQFHDANGNLAPASSVLDSTVDVPVGERMAYEHFGAICTAVSELAGIHLLRGGPWGPLGGVDPLFAANGIIAPRDASSRPAEERRKYSFRWGSSGVTAREALSSLLGRSATTFRWALLCDPPAGGEPRFCTVNVLTLATRTMTSDGKLRPGSEPLDFDRAPKPPVKAPPRTLDTER